MIQLNFKNFIYPVEENIFDFIEVKKTKLKPFREWFLENVNNAGSCPKCGKPMTIRKNRANNVEFLGCTGYPNCTHTAGYNPNVAKQIAAAPKQGVQQNPQQGIQKSSKWFYADVIAKDDVRFKNLEKVALKKRDESTWDCYVLLTGKTHIIPAGQLKALFRSIVGTDGKQITSEYTPSMEDLRSKDPGVSHEYENDGLKKTVDNRMIPDDLMSEEQRLIDAKFENMLKSGQDHLMINALSGTGKTTLLKHLAWKYGKAGQKWLYLVFNTKNKIEASEKFPSFVQVRTTNGFLGEVLGNKDNINKISKTDRLAVLESKNRNEESEKKLEKARMLVDGKAFSDFMDSLKMTEAIPKHVRIDDDYQFNAIKSLLKSIRYNYKEQVLTLVGLAKSYALDPRSDEKLKEGFKKILSDYDFDTSLEEVQEKIAGWRENFRAIIIEILNDIFDADFENIDFSQEIIQGATWLMKEGMPGVTLQKYKQQDKEHNLSDYRDFNDDLWYSATHAEDINWPKFDIVLVDEVQDFNEAQKIMLKKLIDKGTKIVAVGDPNQCVVEGTLIETENGLIPIENISVGSTVLAGKGNGNKISSKVTDVYVKEVKKQLIKITTQSGKILTTTPEHTHFAGYETNDSERYFVYLMYKENMGYRVGVTKNSRSHIHNGYKGRLNQERADKIWLIDQFETKAQAQIYEQYYSVKYGIPTVVFYRNADQNYSQQDIDELFSKIDSRTAALKLLDEKNMFITNPHHIPKCMNRKRYRNFNIVLCGDARGTGLHRYSMAGTDEIILNENVKIRKAKNGWRTESSNADLSKIYEIMNSISDGNEINVIEKARLTDVTLPYIPASHVMQGMDIYISEGDKIKLDIVSKVETIDYEGKVYDINVDKFHNFIANGIVTHNSLYRFRGADSKSFSNIEGLLQGQSSNKNVTQKLTLNFRSRKNIIDFANSETHVKNLKGGKKFNDNNDGSVTKFEQTYGEVFSGMSSEQQEKGKVKETAFIARTNEPLIHAALKLLANNIKFVILGKDIAKDLIKQLGKVVFKFKLKDSDPTKELSNLISQYVDDEKEKHSGQSTKKAYLQELKEVCDAILATLSQFESERGGGNQYISIGEYKKWISIKLGGFNIEESEADYNAYKEKMKKEKPVVLTTAHRSKGLEFERVYLLRYDLFPHKKAKREEDLEQEENARYVAITRAQDELHIIKLEGQPGYKGKQEDNAESGY